MKVTRKPYRRTNMWKDAPLGSDKRRESNRLWMREWRKNNPEKYHEHIKKQEAKRRVERAEKKSRVRRPEVHAFTSVLN